MKKFLKKEVVYLLVSACLLTACDGNIKQTSDSNIQQTGMACLGSNNDTLVESMPSGTCKAGDRIGTKNPAYFCDFSYSVAYNNYNSAFCVYTGKPPTERTEQTEQTEQK